MPDQDPEVFEQYPTSAEIINFYLGMLIGFSVGLVAGGGIILTLTQ